MQELVVFNQFKPNWGWHVQEHAWHLVPSLVMLSECLPFVEEFDHFQISAAVCFHRLDVPDAEEKARTFVVEAGEKLWIYDLWFVSWFESVNRNSTTMQNYMSTAFFEVQPPGTRVVSTIFHLLAPLITAWCVEIISIMIVYFHGSEKGKLASGQAMKNKVLRETWPDPEEPDEWRGLTEISQDADVERYWKPFFRDVSYHPPDAICTRLCFLNLYIIQYL